MKFINKKQHVDLINDEKIRIKVKEKDNARYILFRLLENGKSFDLTGKTVRFFARKPDGKEAFNSVTVTSAENGECELKLTSQTLAVKGIAECELVIYENEDILSTFIFELDVKRTVRSESAIESSNEFNALESLLIEVDRWNNEFADKSGQLETLYTDRLNKMAIINILSYIELVKETNGVQNWTEAFNKAFLDLPNGGILVIPNGEYRITRATLQNKKGITINCSGTIMPMDGETPLIGTVTMLNITDSIFNGLYFDGNKENVINTNEYGTQSLLRFDNASNCIFNNITFKNTCESGFNSNGNLNNIIFSNINIYNMGEHGFYFGGTNVKNIKFNNLYVEDIGMSDVNQSRYTGVIKFRNKTAEDLMHDNISIDGFEFKSLQDGITGYKYLILGYDVTNINIKNGSIEGARTCIFSSNISLDCINIDNIKFNGKYLFYGFNSTTGYNTEAVSGIRKIEISNSELTCECKNYLEITRISNSKIKLNGNWDDTMSLKDLENNILFENVEFDMSTYRFALSKLNRTLKHKKCTFKNVSPTSPLFEINNDDENIYDITFDDVDDVEDHSLFIQTRSNYNLNFINSTIRSNIKTINQVNSILIANTKLKTPKVNTYATADKWILNNVLDLNGVRYELNGDLISGQVQLSGDTGYRFLSGNLVLVWGSAVIQNSGYSAEIVVTLPLQVKKVGYPVWGIFDASAPVVANAKNKTTTGFTLEVKALTPASGSPTGIGAVRVNYQVVCEI